jgi:hypothetical protein
MYFYNVRYALIANIEKNVSKRICQPPLKSTKRIFFIIITLFKKINKYTLKEKMSS